MHYRFLNAPTEEEKARIVEIRKAHRAYVTHCRERVGQYLQLGKDHPDLFLVMAVDGMDSAKTQVPTTRSDALFNKDLETTGRPQDTRLVWAPVAGHGFYGFWVHPWFKQGGSGMASLLIRLLKAILLRRGDLPRVLILLLDNTCKENKNNTVVKFLSLLVAYKVFDEVWVVFLPVGHTHGIIDQRFSVIHRRLVAFDGFTVEQLLEEARKLCLGAETAAHNTWEEVKVAQDWGWLDAVSYRFQGFNTIRDQDGKKHAAHVLRLHRQQLPQQQQQPQEAEQWETPDDNWWSSVVFSYKEHDSNLPWQGHPISRVPLQVFHTRPFLPTRPCPLPRFPLRELEGIRLKVKTLLDYLKHDTAGKPS
jgi:hypothetical protein